MNKKIFCKVWRAITISILASKYVSLALSVPFKGNPTSYLVDILKVILPELTADIKRHFPKYGGIIALVLLLVTKVSVYAAGCEGASGDICT